MTWSQTPVVTWLLAITPPGLLPSALSTASAFSTLLDGLSLRSTTIHFSELNTDPALLIQSGFGLLLPGLPSDFTTELPAMLYSGGTSTAHTAQRQGKPYKETYCMCHSPQCQGKPCKEVHIFSTSDMCGHPLGNIIEVHLPFGRFPTIRACWAQEGPFYFL